VRLEISEGSINQGIYALLCLIIRFAQVRSENGYSFFFLWKEFGVSFGRPLFLPKYVFLAGEQLVTILLPQKTSRNEPLRR
jgi:hypothetical protein